MRTVLEEFESRRQLLTSLRESEAGPRLGAFLAWMESQEEISKILEQIRSKVDVRAILAKCDQGSPPAVGDPEEVAAVGLFFMAECRRGKPIFSLAYENGIRSGYGGNAAQGFVDEVLRRFIDPAVEFVEQRLEELESASTVEQLVSWRVQELFEASFEEEYPETAQHIRRCAVEFSKLDEEGAWFNVGNSCREALKAFATEVSARPGVGTPDGAKLGDVKVILKHAVRRVRGKDSFGERLVELIAAVWDHTQSIVHRESTSRSEAQRVFIWSALTILEVSDLLATAGKPTGGRTHEQ